jgi:hypothetical protein
MTINPTRYKKDIDYQKLECEVLDIYEPYIHTRDLKNV